MDPRLFETACRGDTDELRKLLEEDRFMLERCLMAPYSETVLHVASMAGQAGFSKEVLMLKPELSSILNKDGFAAIHLASAHGFGDTVRELLMVNREHGHLRSSDSRTPLHVAAVTGRSAIIWELLSICPAGIEDVTIRGETAFHLAVKNNHLEAFRTLVESLNHSNMKDLLNAKDEDGNTVLHLATARKQGLIMKLLLGDGDLAGVVNVNLTNNSGFTALDLLDVVQQIVNEPGDYILRDLLLRSGAMRASELIMASSSATPQAPRKISITEPPQIQNQQNALVMKKTSLLNLSKFWKMSVKELEQSSEGTKNALMVVVVLIATVTYQVVLQPPGGFEDDPVLTRLYRYTTFDPPVPFMITARMARDMPVFIPFIVLNSVGFFTSIAVIILLINRFPLKRLLHLAVFSMAATYACGFFFIAPVGLIFALTVPLTMAIVVIADPGGFIICFSKTMTRFAVRIRGVSRNETPVGA